MSYDPPPQTPQNQPPVYQPESTFTTPYTMGGSAYGGLDTRPTADGDRWALIAITVVGMVLLSCVPGLNCLTPLAPLVVGIVTLMRAKNAVNPQQAKLYGWIAVAVGGLAVLVLLAIVGLYGALFVSTFNELQNTPGLTSP